MTTTLLPSRNATIDAAHSSVSFVARHLVVSSVRGVFTEVSGTITIDDNDFQQALTRESKPIPFARMSPIATRTYGVPTSCIARAIRPSRFKRRASLRKALRFFELTERSRFAVFPGRSH